MDNSKHRPAQQELDRFLQSIPDRMRELFETVHYDDALKKLENAENPTPAWIASQLRSLRVKARTIRAAVSEMAETTETLLSRYVDEGGTDALRIAHAREELLFLRKTLEDQDVQTARLEQLGQNTALLREQKDRLDALEVEQFRRKFGKP